PARWFDGSGLEDNYKSEKEFIPAFKVEYIPYNFSNNCPRSLRAIIEAELVKSSRLTLIEIFSFADQMDKVYSIQPDPKSGKSNISPIIDALFISFPKSSDPNPMAMDLDDIQVQFNNLNR
ncbi:hypothetical protein FBU30_003077, partial [Linnemannia zychae]